MSLRELAGKRTFIPLLYGSYPIATLLAANLGEIPLGEGLRSQAIVLLSVALLTLLLAWVFGSADKAAVMATLIVVVFFSYGHLYELLRTLRVGDVVLGRHRYLFLLLVGLLLGAAWVLRKRRSISPLVFQFLTVVVIAALSLPALQITWQGLADLRAQPDVQQPSEEPLPVSLPSDQPVRDVYFIILDAYTRDDVLLTEFGHDNTGFIHALEDLGFWVARQSRSNYAVTRLSLPATLNMDYIDQLGYDIDPQATDPAWLDKVGRYSRVRQAFERMGYRIVAFESAYGLTDWQDVDLYLSPRSILMTDAVAFSGMNTFEQLLLQTTMVRLMIDFRVKVQELFGIEVLDPNQQHRDRILFALDRVGRLHEVPGPKFVFLHLMSPHPPYIFDAEGGLAPLEGIFSLADGEMTATGVSEREAYRNQIHYLNARILEAVSSLIQYSDPEPIIVLLGDHGAFKVSKEDRMKIFNAAYLPELGAVELPEQITPVNTFRVIFDRYFNGDFALLEDRSYFSRIEQPFALERIP